MKFINKIWDVLFPTNIKCIFCGEELDGTTSNCTCKECLDKLPFITKPCPRCGVGLKQEEEGVCFNCKSLNYNFSFARASLDYTGEVVKVIHKFKFNGFKFLAELLSGFMCDVLARLDFETDVICAVPIHKNRLKERGFNQSELLAREVSKKFSISYLELCEKIKENPSQTTLDFKLRQDNVKGVYAVVKEHKRVIKGANILLVDDIFTTGATCNEISKILRKAGAKEVLVLTLAHTPIPEEMKKGKKNTV